MAKKRTMDELRQTKEYQISMQGGDYIKPATKPAKSTGEIMSELEVDTKNPWALYGAPKIGSEGIVESEMDDEAEVDDESNSYYEFVKKLKDLRKQYLNDTEFGYHVSKELL
jgi:hypothetical protein